MTSVRNDTATTRCPLCSARFTPTGRQQYVTRPDTSQPLSKRDFLAGGEAWAADAHVAAAAGDAAAVEFGDER